MTDSSGSTSQLNPSKISERTLSELEQEPRKRKNTCRVGLYGAFEKWRLFKDEMKLKTDKDVAEFLIDSYNAKNRLCDAETQTESIIATMGSLSEEQRRQMSQQPDSPGIINIH